MSRNIVVVSTRMEDNGARSNPHAKVELARLADRHSRLVAKALTNPVLPRCAPTKATPVLETLTRVLEEAGRPLRACEAHATAERLSG